VDALGNLVRFILMPANRYDTVGVAPLIKGVQFGAMLADKAFDSDWIIEDMNERGAKIVISQRPQPLAIDDEMYKWRHLIENYFQKLKEFKRIAMRSDKTDTSFAAMTNLSHSASSHSNERITPSNRAIKHIGTVAVRLAVILRKFRLRRGAGSLWLRRVAHGESRPCELCGAFI